MATMTWDQLAALLLVLFWAAFFIGAVCGYFEALRRARQDGRLRTRKEDRR